MRHRGKRVASRIDRASESARPEGANGVAAPLMIPSTEAQNEFGRVLDRAAEQDIAITRHNIVRAVLVSAGRYRQLTGQPASRLDELEGQFEELYASMQTPTAQEATARALAAAPEEMGRAAVAAARRPRGRGRRK